MSWGDSYGYGVPQSAKDVAAAFYAGKSCRRTNCMTEGEFYQLEGRLIARRIKPEYMPIEVEKAILGRPYRRALEFSFAGRLMPMTCRHLIALGLDCKLVTEHDYGPKGGFINPHPIALVAGSKVDPNVWYSLEDFASMPKWEQPKWVRPCWMKTPSGIVHKNLELAF